MSQPAELELRQLLSRQTAPDELLKIALVRLGDFSLPWEERRLFWYFLFNTGCFEEVWQLLRDHLEAKSRVPFDLLITLADQAQTVPSKTVIEALLKGIKKQSALEDLLQAKGFDKWDARFKELRQNTLDSIRGTEIKKRTDLLEKFEFLKNERLPDQAAEVLRDLRRLFPEDETILGLERELQEKQAREVVHKQTPLEKDLELPENPKIPPSDADLEMVRQFLAEAERLATTHPDLPYQVAIGGAFMEQFAAVKDVLAHAPESPARDWLLAELLFLSRHFVECLEHLNSLEVKYAQDPESTFAVSYLRAQALKKLGQSERAIEILQSLTRIRPHYRSAQRLLQEWTTSLGVR